jgi:hypothetical protein
MTQYLSGILLVQRTEDSRLVREGAVGWSGRRRSIAVPLEEGGTPADEVVVVLRAQILRVPSKPSLVCSVL